MTLIHGLTGLTAREACIINVVRCLVPYVEYLHGVVTFKIVCESIISGLAHLPTAWEIHKRALPYFAALWGDDDLMVSFDGR